MDTEEQIINQLKKVFKEEGAIIVFASTDEKTLVFGNVKKDCMVEFLRELCDTEEIKAMFEKAMEEECPTLLH